MILLTRLGGRRFALNPDLIEQVEATPDTVVTMICGTKYVVVETIDELLDRVREYRADIIAVADRFDAGRAAMHRLRVVAEPTEASETEPI